MSTKNTNLSKSYFPLSRMHKRINDFFEDFFSDTSYMNPSENLGRWVPSINVSESNNLITVKAELPSINEKDINITIQKNRLSISGEKKTEKDEEKNAYHISEISYGKFSRSITLPFNIDPENAKASFSNGVLIINIPKPKEEKNDTKTIPITHEG